MGGHVAVVLHRRVVTGIAALAIIVGAVVVPTAPALAAHRVANASHAKKHYTLGVSFYTNTIPFIINMDKGMVKEAKKLGVSLDVSYANFSASEQSNEIADFVTKHVDMILCTPINQAALAPAYAAARSAGIKVISDTTNIPTIDATPHSKTVIVGQTVLKDGEYQMNFVSKKLHGTGTFAEISGPSTLAFVGQEKEGYRRVIAKHPGLQLIATETAPTLSESTGLTLGEDVLTAHPTVQAIVTTDDTIALGVAEALKERGYKPGQVTVVGLDGTPRVITSIKHGGYIQFTDSSEGRVWGELAIKTAEAWLSGHQPKRYIRTPTLVITKKNVKDLKPVDIT